MMYSVALVFKYLISLMPWEGRQVLLLMHHRKVHFKIKPTDWFLSSGAMTRPAAIRESVSEVCWLL